MAEQSRSDRVLAECSCVAGPIVPSRRAQMTKALAGGPLLARMAELSPRGGEMLALAK